LIVLTIDSLSRELTFTKGDILSVRRAIDKNWHEGEIKGVVGIFPSNYVEVITLSIIFVNKPRAIHLYCNPE